MTCDPHTSPQAHAERPPRDIASCSFIRAELLDPIEIENGRIKPFLEFCDVQ
mgnify:CR=1 FL=1